MRTIIYHNNLFVKRLENNDFIFYAEKILTSKSYDEEEDLV